jgi:tyrosinase
MLNRRQLLLTGTGISLAWDTRQAAPAPALRVRRAINGLPANDPIVQDYAKAVAALKNLPASDRRNWTKMAEIHNYRCPHHNWYFLPWHRAYLCQFEKICADVIDKPGFALPYWDWTASPDIPAPFLDSSSPLYDNTRRSKTITSSTVGRRNINRILGITDFEAFASRQAPVQRPIRPAGDGDLEGGPHNTVHGQISGDMGAYMSPLDPIFWMHHCNIDRLWDSWLALSNSNAPALATSSYEFKYVGGESMPAPDEYKAGDFVTVSGERVTIKCSEAMDSAPCGYGYDRLEKPTVAAVTALVLPQGGRALSPDLSATSQTPGGTPLLAGTAASLAVTLNQNAKAVRVSAPPQARTVDERRDLFLTKFSDKRALTSDVSVGRVVANLTLSGAIPNATTMRVFVNSPNPTAETPTSDPHFVTEIASFGAHDMGDAPARFLIDVTDALAAAGGGEPVNVEAVRVQLVPVGESPKITLQSLSVTIT